MKFQHDKDTTGRCSVEGHNAEKVFRDSLNFYAGEDAVLSETVQQQWDGIDVQSMVLGSFDVKARKRGNRWEKLPQDKYIWVEFQNVGGGKGWLYSRADYLAFEQEDEFIVVGRKEFKEMCEVLCDLSGNVDSANKAIYKAYQRKDRKDIISKIKTQDIFDYIKFFILPKNI